MKVTVKGLRDLFFLMVGTAILYQQFWERPEPSPLGVFVALFLYGLIPAFRADEGSAPGPLAVIAQAMGSLGAKGPPAAPEVKAEPEVRADPEEVARAAGLAGPEVPEVPGAERTGEVPERRFLPPSDGQA